MLIAQSGTISCSSSCAAVTTTPVKAVKPRPGCIITMQAMADTSSTQDCINKFALSFSTFFEYYEKAEEG